MERVPQESRRIEVRDEPVLLVGHSPDEHGILREVLCGAPRPLACRMCKGEQDCPYVSDRSALRMRVTYRDPTDPVPPLAHRHVATGSNGTPADARHPLGLRLAAAGAWLVAVGLVVWFWVVDRPSWGELLALLGLKLAIFVFVVAGIPLVRLTWSHHGGRFRRAP